MLEITGGGHMRGLEVLKASIAWKWLCELHENFPVHRPRRWPTQRPVSTKPFICGSDKTCAAPRLLILQGRAMPAPSLSLMPVRSQSCCHGLHTLGLPHPVFPLPYQRNRVQKHARHGFGNLSMSNVVCSRIAVVMQKITGGGIRFSKTAQQNTAYPVHKIGLRKKKKKQNGIKKTG